MTEQATIEFFMERQKLYRVDPLLYWSEVTGYKPDKALERAAYDLVESPRTTIASGHGIGKTAFEANATLWFLPNFYMSRVVATAPSRQQLNDVLWSEIAKWQGQSPLLSTILEWKKTYVDMKGMEKRWFAVARTAKSPENIQGFHADDMLIIVDEASGVADDIMEALENTLSGGNNKMLLCGNPTRSTGFFFLSHTKDRALYKCHTISALDSPRTNKQNIESVIRKYGKDSNVVRVRVYGKFPLAEDDVLIPISLLEAGAKADIVIEDVSMIHIACDVARYGSDKTVIGSRIFNEDGLSEVQFHKQIRGQATTRTTSDIILFAEMLREKHGYVGYIPIKIDDGGVGGGVVDQLRQVKASNPEKYYWMEILPVNFGKLIKHKYYSDTTTYMMAKLKELLMPGGDIEAAISGVESLNPEPPIIKLPDDNDLIGQLSVRKYTITKKNKIQVESKDAMKARNLPSPDEGDCLLLLCLPVNLKGKEVKA